MNSAIDLQYRTGGHDDRLGIWIKEGVTDYVVNPYALANSLCISVNEPICNYASDNTENIYSGQWKLTLYEDEYELRHQSKCVYKQNCDIYIKVAKDLLQKLCDDICNAVPTVYNSACLDEIALNRTYLN